MVCPLDCVPIGWRAHWMACPLDGMPIEWRANWMVCGRERGEELPRFQALLPEPRLFAQAVFSVGCSHWFLDSKEERSPEQMQGSHFHMKPLLELDTPGAL